MRHLAAVAVAASTLGALGACGPRPAPAGAALAREGPAPEPSTEPVDGLMRRKVVHAQALVVAITRADFGTVEDSAAQLYQLSDEAEWMVHDTVAYTVFSERFRQIAATLAEHARQQDLEAVTTEYTRLMQSCVDCHSYLRRERLIKDYPAEVSDALPAGAKDGRGRAG